MKKEIYTLIIKSVLAICITAVTITVLPKSSVIDNTKSIDVFHLHKLFLLLKISAAIKTAPPKKQRKAKKIMKAPFPSSRFPPI